jgi:Mg2+ and Co2+ transporter CorA
LTIIAAVFLPLSFCTGLSGMNCASIPFHKLTSGFYYILGFGTGRGRQAILWCVERTRHCREGEK